MMPLWIPAFACCAVLEVVELASGTRLVGRLEGSGDEAVLLTPSGPAPLAGLVIDRVQQRAELLDLLATRRDLFAGDLRAQVTLADWCLRQGLYAEGLDLLDEIDPHSPEWEPAERLVVSRAREILLGSIGPVGPWSERDRRKLVISAVGSSAARRLLARSWLLEQPADELGPQCARLLRSSRPEHRTLGAQLLAARPYEPTLDSLLRRSLLDRHEETRQAALHATRQYPADRLLPTYTQALGSQRAAVRDAAYAALEGLQDARSVPALIRVLALHLSTGSSGPPRNHVQFGRQISLVTDYEVEIAQGAVIADPEIGIVHDGATLDVRVAASSSVPHVERRRIARILFQITGQDLGEEFEPWARWWNENGEQLLAASPVTSSETAQAAAADTPSSQ